MTTRPAVRAMNSCPAALRVIASLLAVVLAMGCSEAPSAEAAPPDAAVTPRPLNTAVLSPDAVQLAGIELATAESIAWQESWRAPARLVLDPAVTHPLGAVAEGRVTRVLVVAGDRVFAGQPLVAIHSHEMTDAVSAVASAAAADIGAGSALAVARSAAARAERLLVIRALSVADAERARASLAQAEARRIQVSAELSRARAMLDHLTGGSAGSTEAATHEVLVRSPVDGFVISREAQPGAVVLVGSPLVTVSEARLLVSMRLPEHAAGAARPGAGVGFSVSGLPGERFEARVERVAPTIDSLTRTIEVLARPTRPSSALRAEMSGTAELLGAAGDRVLVVPAAAVQGFEGDTVVVTGRAQPEGLSLEAVRVRVGRRTEERAEILAGLAPGTPVVVRGAAVAKAEILRRRGDE